VNIAGIDPGLSGAMAIVDEHSVVFVGDLSVLQIPSGKKTRAELDLASLRALLAGAAIDHIFIEQVAARPGQGTVSMFRFGQTFGRIEGVVATLQLPYSMILPQRWQKLIGCGPSPDAARQRAGQLYPEIAPKLTRKKDGGRADAILIARAGLLTLNQTTRIVAE
jgi:crossover junction endodeoxyribonuclease RuvC